MQARLLHDEERINPDYSRREAIAARKKRRRYDVPKTLPLPAGTIIDRPDAWKLVVIGAAEPVDGECRAAAKMTDAQLRREQRRHAAIRSGHIKSSEEA